MQSLEVGRDGLRSGCAINAAVEAPGDRWSLIVLHDVIFGGRRHFRDLLAHSKEGIASNILSSSLPIPRRRRTSHQERADRGPTASPRLHPGRPDMAVLGPWGLRHPLDDTSAGRPRPAPALHAFAIRRQARDIVSAFDSVQVDVDASDRSFGYGGGRDLSRLEDDARDTRAA